MSQKKIGVFGGSFNPIHIGHLRTAEETRQCLGMDKIVFVPSFNPPFEKKGLAPFSHRLNMLQLAIEENPYYSLSAIESETPGKSFTVNTIEALMERNPDCTLFLIMGTDAFLELPQWHKPDKLISMVDILVILRPPLNLLQLTQTPFFDAVDKEKLTSLNSEKKLELPPNVGNKKITFLRTTSLDVSATQIRQMIKQKESVKYLLPQKVESYIISNRLYL